MSGPPARVFQGWWVHSGRGDISAAYSVMTLAIVVFLPVVGSLVDRFGVRRILLPSIVLFATAAGSMSL
ncbi:hypothetical protein [Steroidobacter denitrificans]|uniref:hypothetical protein n=1 Tax=Steroidobacter denitrificans TaxID=465721 RepID=UPI0012ECFB86|nr:hypothetical protein [Steroidobacter denitrificans]